MVVERMSGGHLIPRTFAGVTMHGGSFASFSECPLAVHRSGGQAANGSVGRRLIGTAVCVQTVFGPVAAADSHFVCPGA